MISSSDKDIITTQLMPYFKVGALLIRYSPSKKKYPDIWCVPSQHVIYVTDEWARQGQAERMKRVTHELIHIAWGWQDNIRVGRYVYHTKPVLDTYSRMLYRKIRSGK